MLTPIRHSILVFAPPESVFPLLSSDEGWCRWLCSDATFEASPGGKLSLRWKPLPGQDPPLAVEGTVLLIDPPRKVVFRWNQSGQATSVALYCIPGEQNGYPGATVVGVEESGFAETPDGHRAVLDSATAWGETLMLLKMYAEHRVTYATAFHSAKE
jgi:uncharacterized protein YndB with AHSA1/START domain